MDEESPGRDIRDLFAALQEAAGKPVTLLDGRLTVTLPSDSPRMPLVHTLLADRGGWRIKTRPDGQADVVIDLDQQEDS